METGNHRSSCSQLEIGSFQSRLAWIKCQKDVDPVQLVQLRRMLEFAVRTKCNTLKQMNLFEYGIFKCKGN